MLVRWKKPNYRKSYQEFMIEVVKVLDIHGTYFRVNEYPYSCEYKHWDETFVKVEHYTLFYRDFDDAVPYIKKMKEKGFQYYEAADDDKSINVPHVHFTKKI